jgi:prophage tail gpP-like protein
VPKEIVTVVAGGQSFRNWLSVSVEAGAKQAARAFSITAAEPDQAFGDDWPLMPGTPVDVMASGDLIVRGYIDDYGPQFDPSSHQVTITGRSKAADAIDSSHTHKTGRFDDKDLGEIAKELDQFGIGFNAETQLEKIPFHQLVPGATVFDELENLARAQGVLLIGEADGSVAITKASEFGRHSGAIVEGRNLKAASAKLSVRKKHSKVTARGQRWKGVGKDNLRIEHTATDQTVKRYRPLVLIVEGDTDKNRVKQRAEWHIKRQTGYETTADVTVYGWRDDGGKLWDPKKLIYLQSKRLKIDQDMAIQKVTFRQNNSEGSVATLSLVDPEALGGKDAKGKSNEAWETGGDE